MGGWRDKWYNNGPSESFVTQPIYSKGKGKGKVFLLQACL